MRLESASLPTVAAGLLAAVLLPSTGWTAGAPAATERPNILWITIEDASLAVGSFGDTYAVTPNIDRLAREGIRYRHAYAPIGVCAPARSSLILGMYAPTAGSQHMRSKVRVAPQIELYPQYLRDSGYYTTNNRKQDYNLAEGDVPYDPVPAAWNDSSGNAHWRNRPDERTPFFAIFNLTTSHESQIRLPEDEYERRMKEMEGRVPNARHDPALADIPPYHPDTPEVRRDWARFADMMTYTDMKVGEILGQLQADGLADDTIVFFYSDHGTGMPRSKRWLYDSSLRVPFVVRFPEKWAHLAPGPPGTVSDRIINFVDLGPTALSLAGIEVPDHMRGKAFLGPYATEPRRYTHGFRDRMDERYDMLRSIKDHRFKYIRNYLPHRIYGQYLAYMFLMPTTRVWKEMYDAARLQGPQKYFWEEKPSEELYDTWADPHEVHNLAGDPEYRPQLERLRRDLDAWILESRDTGFLAEAEMHLRSGDRSPYEMGQDTAAYDLPRILEAANRASMRDPMNVGRFIGDLKDADSGVRYWAATGIVSLGEKARSARGALLDALEDPSPDVAIAAAEGLIGLGERERSIGLLERALQNQNEFVRLHAANVLDWVGDAARPALPALRAAAAAEPEGTYPSRLLPYVVEKLSGSSGS